VLEGAQPGSGPLHDPEAARSRARVDPEYRHSERLRAASDVPAPARWGI
jgi:hypothetical protein